MILSKKSDVSFLMLKCWNENIGLLNEKQKAQLLTAIYDFQCYGNDFVTNDGMLKMLWATIKQTFEYNNRKYEERCEKNRQAAQARYKGKTSHKSDASYNIDELMKFE